ncbi:MAG: Fructose-bisphosphate aldolase class-I [Candidatus Udaeobacter sp.]|nr:MAG: Fructose-bisphosphate aldolase class-I [Candidatus Udaeobacter sp.]
MKTENLESIAKNSSHRARGSWQPTKARDDREAIEGHQRSLDRRNRRAYREILFTTSGAGEFISGVILFDETIRQKTRDGRTFVKALEEQGIIPGIKVDEGAKAMANFSGEKITEGLDGLRERLAEYRQWEHGSRNGGR